jgi:hypothetical protein
MIKSNIPVNGDEMHAGWQLGDCTYSCSSNVYRQAGRQRGDAAEFADISGKHKVMFSGFMCIKIKCIEIVRDCRKTSKKQGYSVYS